MRKGGKKAKAMTVLRDATRMVTRSRKKAMMMAWRNVTRREAKKGVRAVECVRKSGVLSEEERMRGRMWRRMRRSL